MGKASRDKGRRFEQQIARELRERLGIDVKRGQQGRSGSDGADIEAEGLPYWFELKVAARAPNILGAMRQAVEATDGRTPVVISKRDREDPLVTMQWEAWLDLIHRTSLIWEAAQTMIKAQNMMQIKQLEQVRDGLVDILEIDEGVASGEVTPSPNYLPDPDLDDDDGGGVPH